MKLSYNWLKELVDLPWDPQTTGEKLAELGFPVEKLTISGIQVSNVIAVKILAVSKHPNADRLQIARVTDGKTEKDIVCGAPNIAPGQIVPLAVAGAKLPGGLEITVSKIRGVESQGMLCSERELGISEEHGGILQLPADAQLGREAKDVLGGSDAILEIEVTPNRPDMLSHVGVARELAALAMKPLKLPIADGKNAPAKKAGDAFPISITEPALSSRYIGRVITGVKIGLSPDWLVRRLKACGIRSINNVVDITNYVLLEWGHPLHAFDLTKLAGPEIIVRRAKAGEKLAALDEKTYELTEKDLVIADAKGPVAIAGIMGGQPTGVTDSTRDILLESAVFDSVTVRQSSRRLALRSESSIRFEKGTDTDTAAAASARAAQLIQELAGGETGPITDTFPTKTGAGAVSLRRERLNLMLGHTVPPETVENVLTRLSLAPTKNANGWTCKPPLFRRDIVEEVDLIEEVARLVGYNALPTRFEPVVSSNRPTSYLAPDNRKLLGILKGAGLNETISSSFCPPELAARLGFETGKLVSMANPLSQEESALRPLLAPNLLRAAANNLNHQRSSVALFEIGNVFERSLDGHRETTRLGIVLCGTLNDKEWNRDARHVDFFYLKGLVETLGSRLNIGLEIRGASDRPFLHPHQSAALSHRGTEIGWMGTLHPTAAAEMGIEVPCVVAELDFAPLQPSSEGRTFRPLARYPFVERDIAVVVDKNLAWERIAKTAQKSGGDLVTALQPFDLFSGGNLPADKKSVAFRIRLQHADHTLSEAEINGAVDRIKTSLQHACGAQLR